MATALSFTLDGWVYAARGDVGANEIVLRLDVTVLPNEIVVLVTKPKWLVFSEKLEWRLPAESCAVERLDEGRSVGKAAGGAIVGALIAGPLGLLAGAALGGRKKHLVAIRRDDMTLVAELSPSELQGFFARGLVTTG